MELRELRAFEAIVEEQSFRRAADRLYLTPSALSHQIGRLEREMSQALLVRATEGVYATTAGEVILDFARKIFTDIRVAREQLGLPGESEREKLRVTGTSVGLTYIYGELCEQYMRTNAQIELEIMAAETTQMASTRVVRGEADLAFTTLPIQSKALDMVAIGRSEQVFIVGAKHPLAKSKKVSLDEVRRFPFARYLKGSAGRALSDKLFGSGQYPPVASETNDTEVVKRIVKLGFATALVPVFTIGQELASAEIKPLRLSTGPMMLDFGLVYRKKDNSKKVQDFISFCASQNDKSYEVNIKSFAAKSGRCRLPRHFLKVHDHHTRAIARKSFNATKASCLTVQLDGTPIEVLRVEVPKYSVGIGDCGFAASTSVAHRPRIRTCAVRADLDQAHVHAGDAAAARADLQKLDGRDIEWQSAPLQKPDHVHFESRSNRGPAVVDGAELGGRSPHVEGQHLAQSQFLANLCAHQDASGRTGLHDTDRIVACRLW